MKGLNLKEFEKIKEDKDTVHMKNKDGHVIVLAVKALPKIQREQLKRLPLYAGGEVKGVHGAEKYGTHRPPAGVSLMGESARRGESFAKHASRENLKELKSMPNPKLKGLADGGEVDAIPVNASKLESQYAPEDAKAEASATPPPININVNPSPAPVQAPAPQPPVQVAPPVRRAPAMAQPAMSGNGIQQEAQKTLGGIGLEQNAIKMQQEIDAQKAQQAIPAMEANLIANQKIAQQNEDARDRVNAAADRLRLYQEQHPQDQDQYFKKMGAGEKISSAIGLLLGGFHSGFTHGNDPAMDFLNNQITRNIEQQKANFANEKSVYGAFHEAFQDNAVATTLATANAKERLANQINLVAAKMGTQEAAKNAAFANAKLLKDSHDLRQNAAGALGNVYRTKAQGSAPQSGQTGPIQNISAPAGNNAQAPSDRERDFTILKPGAAEEVDRLIKYDSSIPEVTKTKMASQLTQASQAEKSLKQLRAKFAHLINGANEGGYSGRINRTISPHALGALGAGIGTLINPGAGTVAGGAIGEGVGAGIRQLTNTDINRRFDSDKSNLFSFLSSAVPGRGSEKIQEIVDRNTPEYGDDDRTLDRKLETIREFIINHTETDALKGHVVSYR